MNKLGLILIALLVGNTQIKAQENAKDELGAWYILASNSKLNDHVNVQLQTQFRFFETTSEIQQIKIRTGVSYKVSNAVKFGLGYAFFNNDPSYLGDTPDKFNEHRLVLDAFLKNKFSKLSLQHRYRFEQRFFEGNMDSSAWIRYMLQAAYPLSDKITADVYNEVFLNLQGDSFFSQNWLGFGLGYKINSLMSIRVGYQNIQTQGPDFNRILLGLTFKPDFSKGS